MVEPIQVLAVVIAVFAISRAFLRLKERRISIPGFTFWVCVWSAVVIVAFIPGITFYFSELLGINRGIDFVVYLSILLLFYLIFRIYVKLEQTEQNITKLTRAIAINKRKKK